MIGDNRGITSQPQSETLVFRGLGAEPSNKLFARGITGALLARFQLGVIIIEYLMTVKD